MNGIHPATNTNPKGVFSYHRFSGKYAFFLGETFSPPHPLLATGQSLNSSWRQTHHRAIPRKGEQDLQLGPVEKAGERDLKNACLSYLETRMIFMVLLCFLESNFKQKFAKAR